MQGDITKIQCDAIVNAANITLLGEGGIDKVMHEAAVPELMNKCEKVPIKGQIDKKDVPCYPGECEVTDTKGCKLRNCKYVFHTVGPARCAKKLCSIMLEY